MSSFLMCILHCPRYNSRLSIINTLLEKITKSDKITTKVEIIDSHNPDTLNISQIKEVVKLDQLKTNTIFDNLTKNLHVKHISHLMKHYDALQRFCSQDIYDTMLVLEDDVLYGEDIVDQIVEAYNTFQDNAKETVMFLGCPIPMSISNTKGMHFVFDSFNILPTCDSYFINKAVAKKMLSIFLPIRFLSTVHMSYLSKIHDIKYTFYNNNIFVNGTKFGVFVSSLDTNNKLFMNSDFNRIGMLLSKEELSTEDIDFIENIEKTIPFKEHPDFLYMFGLFYKKQKEYLKALKYFETAYKNYVSNDSIINNESEFLKDYIKLYQYLQ